MIIRCRQCRTKYAFDDALMQGDGVWMRCSRCQHVFFLDNPLTIKQPIEASINRTSAFAKDALPAQGNGEVSYEEMLPSGKDADVVQFLNNVMEGEKNYSKDLEAMTGRDEGFNQTIPVETKGFWKTWKTAVWSIFVILIIPAVIYFFIFVFFGNNINCCGESLFVGQKRSDVVKQDALLRPVGDTANVFCQIYLVLFFQWTIKIIRCS